MFIAEEQWSRAYEAAKAEVALLSSTDGLPPMPVAVANRLAIRIATVALRAAAQDDIGDIGDVPGVHVQHIDTSTSNYPHSHHRVTVRPADSETALELRAQGFPPSMTEPVTFGGSPDEGLTEVALVAIDESEDGW